MATGVWRDALKEERPGGTILLPVELQHHMSVQPFRFTQLQGSTPMFHPPSGQSPLDEHKEPAPLIEVLEGLVGQQNSFGLKTIAGVDIF